MENPEIFADFYNGVLFNGKPVITPQNLMPIPGNDKDLLRGKDGYSIPVIRYRDIIKACRTETDFVLLALENETKIDYTMVVRTMLYDAMTYQTQIREKQRYNQNQGHFRSKDEFFSKWRAEDSIHPVITCILYYGAEPWNGKKSLADFVHLDAYPEEIQPYFQDYRLNLLEVRNFNNPEIFHTELGRFFRLLSIGDDREELKKYILNRDAPLVLSSQCLEVLSALMEDRQGGPLSNLLKNTQGKGADVNMTNPFTVLCESFREDGLTEGLKAFIELCMEFGISREDTRDRLAERFSLSLNTAEDYLTAYWK